MIQTPSRKQFFAKLLGAAAAASVLPKALANTQVSARGARPARAIVVRGDSRAVARRDLN
ncbi:MAG: hypothetical protein JNL39_16120 [Opitutaceae bacterium]|nr:hypothetical protein [Opitutaceae bacterium]